MFKGKLVSQRRFLLLRRNWKNKALFKKWGRSKRNCCRTTSLTGMPFLREGLFKGKLFAQKRGFQRGHAGTEKMRLTATLLTMMKSYHNFTMELKNIYRLQTRNSLGFGLGGLFCVLMRRNQHSHPLFFSDELVVVLASWWLLPTDAEYFASMVDPCLAIFLSAVVIRYPMSPCSAIKMRVQTST